MEQNRKAMLAYILPFAVWMGLMFALPADAPSYAIRSAATLAVGIACFVLGRRIAPTASSRIRLPAIALGLLAGAAVCAFWIALPAWPFPEPTAPAPSPYAPHICGWPLTVAITTVHLFLPPPVMRFLISSKAYFAASALIKSPGRYTLPFS